MCGKSFNPTSKQVTPTATHTGEEPHQCNACEKAHQCSVCGKTFGYHVDLAKHPFTYFTCGEAIAEVGHLELIFTSCPYSSFLRKNSWSRTKTNSKGVPRPT